MNLALFDFDGTITTEDMYSKFLGYSASGLRFYLARTVLLPFYLLFRAGLLSPKLMRRLSRVIVFRGRKCQPLDEMALTYSKVVISKFVRDVAKEKITWHMQQGDTVVVVSASLDIYLRPWCQAIGIDLICNELQRANGKFTGRLTSTDCSQSLKAEKVMDNYNLDDFNTIYAYGDTHEDMAMLALADEKYMNWKKLSI